METESYSGGMTDEGGASKWQRMIQSALDSEGHKKFIKCINENRKALSGQQWQDAPGLVRTNLLFSSMATIIPYTYAKDPDISVVPAESTDPQAYGPLKAFTETLQTVISRQLFVDGRMKHKLRAALRSEWTTGIGALKITYQRDMETDPLIQNRINDAQDNVSRLMKLIESTEEGAQRADYKADMEELQLQIKGLEAQVEVVKAEGLCIDNIMTEDLLILDDTVKVFEDYPNARAIAHCIWYEKEEYLEQFGKGEGNDPLRGAHVFEHPDDDKERRPSRESTCKAFVRVWEIWHKVSNTVYTVCQGAQGYCRPPYQPERTGERWYPIFLLAFNQIDGQFEPLAPVGLARDLQSEYDTTRTNYAEHRAENLPVRVFRAGGSLDEEDINALKDRKANDWVGIKGNPNVSLENDIAILQNPLVRAEDYDPTQTLNDMDKVFGLTDASRSVLIEPKTATEAKYLREGMGIRTSDRKTVMEDAICDMAQYAAEILLQELTEEQAKQLAGQAAVWPLMYRPDIFNMVSVQITAGSTGKPDKEGEQERWIQIMPMIKESIMEIKTMEATGAIEIANAYRMLLEETLSRFDERLDLNAYLGPKLDMPLLPGTPGLAPTGPGLGAPLPGELGLQGPAGPPLPGGQPSTIPGPMPPAMPMAAPSLGGAGAPMPQAPGMDGASMGLIGGTLASLTSDIAEIKAKLNQAQCGTPIAGPQPMTAQPEELEIQRMPDGSLVGRRGSKSFVMRREPEGNLKGIVVDTRDKTLASI